MKAGLRLIGLGWLTQDDSKVLAVARNMGEVNMEGSLQVPGRIHGCRF